jgi:peptidoglycan/LPS O-acetylase OafA/YrhL
MAPPARTFQPITYTTRFPALDGLRALAVTMVFAFHYGGGAHSGSLLRAVNAMRLQGWAGVDLFFALSGFLITGVLYDTRGDSKYFSRFYARRTLRIFPLYYLLVLILLILTPIFHYHWSALHLLFLVYLGNIPSALTPAMYQIHSNYKAADLYIGHLWTLSVEEQFYLLWPLIVWRVRNRLTLLRVAIGLSFLAILLRVWLIFGAKLDLRGGWLLTVLPFHMDSLLIGAVLAMLLRGPNAAAWQRRSKWVFAAALVAVVVAFRLNPPGFMPAVGFPLMGLASAGLIGWVLMPGSIAYQVFHLRPIRVFGKYSYGFYVYHLPFAAAWAWLTAELGRRIHSTQLATGIVLTVNFAFTFLVAKLSYDHFEVRFLRRKRAFEYDSEKTADSSRPYNVG